jgi:hypothetical protein
MKRGKIQSVTIPHLRAKMTGETIGSEFITETYIPYADTNSGRWGYSDAVLSTHLNSPIETHQNSERRYGGEMHIFLTLTALATLDVSSAQPLTLIMSAPPGLMKKVAGELEQAYLRGENGSGDGVWSIKLRTDKKKRTYKIGRVNVVPEGVGGYCAYRFTQKGDIATLNGKDNQDLLGGVVTVMDLGYGTGDFFTIVDGNFNADNIAHATDHTLGIYDNMIKPLLEDIWNAVPDSRHITAAHVDWFLRQWVAGGYSKDASTFTVSGKAITLFDAILKHAKSYAERIAAQRIDPAIRDGSDAIAEVGGGWLYTEATIRQWYANKRPFLAPQDFKHTSHVSLVTANPVGLLELVQYQLKD